MAKIVKTVSEDAGPTSEVTRFDVTVTLASTDEYVTQFRGIIAQTRKEANNKALQKLTFSAERSI